VQNMTDSSLPQKNTLSSHSSPDGEAMGGIEGGQFVRLYSAAYPRVYRYILSLVPRRSDADEVMQETSVVLWQKFNEFLVDRDFTHWACGIARLVVLELLRKQKPFLLGFDEQLVTQLASRREEQYELMELRQEFLEECKEHLTEKDIQLLDLFYGSSKGAQKAASQQGCTLRNIYQQLGRIRRGLFQCIERKIAGEGVR